MNLSSTLALHFCMVIPSVAIIVVLMTGSKPNLREAMSIAFGLALFFCVVNLYQAVLAEESVTAFWLEVLPGLSLSFHVEPLGVLFALIASFLWVVTTIYSIGYMRSHGEKNQTRFYAYFAAAIASAMGIAFASNLFTLFIFYELLTLSTYPLVTHLGTDKAMKGGRTYLGVLIGTSILFFLLAMVITWSIAETLDFKHGGVFAKDVDTMLVSTLLVLFVLGIGKAATMPFHRWLPAAMIAPSPVSALLHAVAVVKAGAFTIIKICVYIFGLEILSVLPSTQFMLYLAGASCLLASLVALRQDNLKARLAYSTISQLGYITIGALLATSSGIVASSMHIAIHAFGKITLFLCAGAILVTLHKSEISKMRGIATQMPFTMVAFFIASLSVIGVPPTGGTWSKFYLLMGTIETQQLVLVVILLASSLLNVAYLIPISFQAFFALPVSRDSLNQEQPGKAAPNALNSRLYGINEAALPSLIAIGITTIGCIILFFFPQPLYELASNILEPSGEFPYGQ